MKKPELFANDSMRIEKLPAYFFFALLIWVAWNLLQVIQPFLMVLIFSAIMATVTFPVYAWLERKFKGRKRIAALLTCLLVMFAIVLPLTFFVFILVGQLVDLVVVSNDYLHTVDFNSLMSWKHGNFFFDLAGPYSGQIGELVMQNLESLRSGMTQAVQIVSTFAAKQSAGLLTDFLIFIFNLLLMLFTLYYFYKDGRFILRKLMLISPIPIKYEKDLYKKFNEISRATLFGTFLTHLSQGIVGYIGFLIAGVPNSFFWAVALTVFSLVPTLGSSLVWLPMGIFMLLSGNWWGIFILIYGAGLISTVDNVMRIVFIGSSARLNPLLTFISVFGGLLAFGLIGVILGPMLLVLFLTLLHVYELEYDGVLGSEKDFGLPEPIFGKK